MLLVYKKIYCGKFRNAHIIIHYKARRFNIGNDKQEITYTQDIIESSLYLTGCKARQYCRMTSSTFESKYVTHYTKLKIVNR